MAKGNKFPYFIRTIQNIKISRTSGHKKRMKYIILILLLTVKHLTDTRRPAFLQRKKKMA